MSYRLWFMLVSLVGSTLQGQPAQFRDSLEVHRTDTIYFEFASAEPAAEAIAGIQQMATDRAEPLFLYIEGHTDAIGPATANERLAKSRSKATLEAFINAGWPADKVELRNFGERNLAINTKRKERRNRRVLMRTGKPKRYTRLSGTITDEAGTPLAGSAVAHGTYLRDTTRTNQEGEFSLWLPLDDSLNIAVTAPGHFYKSVNYYLRSEDAPPQPLKVQLSPVEAGRVFPLDGLYFVGNKTEFLPGGWRSMELLYAFLDGNPDVRVEISGHVNHPGESQPLGSWSYRLAGARAKKVYQELVSRGIISSRLRFKSYSNYEMVHPAPFNDEQRRQNRRVEIRILSKID